MVIKCERLTHELQVVCGRDVVSADGLKLSTGKSLHTGGVALTVKPPAPHITPGSL